MHNDDSDMGGWPLAGTEEQVFNYLARFERGCRVYCGHHDAKLVQAAFCVYGN